MRRFLVRFLVGTGLALCVLLAVLLFNTVRYTADNIVSSDNPGTLAIDQAQVVDRLSQAVRFATVSDQTDGNAFDDFLDWMVQAFPRVHQQMSRTIVGGYTPVYIWSGRNADLPAVLLAAHYDVVPAQSETLAEWTYPPFQGEVADGFVWGRGTLDNKGPLVAMLSAAEYLLAEGFQPQRTIVFSFGHDEEVRGAGATAAVEYLQSITLPVDWSLDEGSFVFNRVIPGLSKPVASINVAEKGVVTLDLIAGAQGGHSSMPPQQTAVGDLSKALTKLEKNPLPGGLRDVSAEFFSGLGPHFEFPQRVLFANQWLFRPLLEYGLGQAPTTHALLRTTAAPTMLSAAPAPNVLPTQAKATVNFRIHPRDTMASVREHVQQAVANDSVTVEFADYPRFDPSPVAQSDTSAYSMISESLAGAFGDVIVVPGLTIGATDSRIYQRIASNSYRVNPFMLEGADLPLLHGIDERVSLDNLRAAVIFYTSLLRAN